MKIVNTIPDYDNIVLKNDSLYQLGVLTDRMTIKDVENPSDLTVSNMISMMFTTADLSDPVVIESSKINATDIQLNANTKYEMSLVYDTKSSQWELAIIDGSLDVVKMVEDFNVIYSNDPVEDPNTTTKNIILTNHTNAPGGDGTWYYITTYTYGNDNNYKTQVAVGFNVNRIESRVFWTGEWNSWKCTSDPETTEVIIPTNITYDNATSGGSFWLIRNVDSFTLYIHELMLTNIGTDHFIVLGFDLPVGYVTRANTTCYNTLTLIDGSANQNILGYPCVIDGHDHRHTYIRIRTNKALNGVLCGQLTIPIVKTGL